MQCLSPRTVGFQADGKTLAWSAKNRSKEFPTFQLNCGKCNECLLLSSLQNAVRCVHEARYRESIGQQSCFVTLTYADDKLQSDRLIFDHLVAFKKKINDIAPGISFFPVGEYGDRFKRPHWHVLIFGWRPDDLIEVGQNKHGDKRYSSKKLDDIWSFGITDVAQVSIKSASYVARYSLKKQNHGPDQEKYQPERRGRSTKNAIGKEWLKKFYKDIFNHGKLVIEKDGSYISIPIPRIYERWLKDLDYNCWLRYVTQVKPEKCAAAEASYQRNFFTDGVLDTKKLYDNRVARKALKKQAHNQLMTSKDV